MGPGLAGFVIVSLLFVGAAMLAPIHELGVAARGGSSRARWANAARQFGIGAGMLAALAVLYVAIDASIRRGWLPGHDGAGLVPRLAGFIYTAAALVVVLATSSILTGVFRRRNRVVDLTEPPAPQHAPGAPAFTELRPMYFTDLTVEHVPRWYETAWSEVGWSTSQETDDPIDQLIASALLDSYPIDRALVHP